MTLEHNPMKVISTPCSLTRTPVGFDVSNALLQERVMICTEGTAQVGYKSWENT